MQQPAKKLNEDSTKMELSWTPKPILPTELSQHPPLEKVFIGVLKNKQSISKAITGLAGCLPSPQFLKRCSGLRIYLTPAAKVNFCNKELKNLLLACKFDLSLLENDFEIAEVPASAPKTKDQMAYVSKFWPVNFHPDHNLESLISGSMFNYQQLISLETCMRLAISASEAAVGSDECNGSTLIIDPEEGTVLAIAATKLDKHPMWHSSMLAIDLVATIQGGGTWNLVDPSETFSGKRKHQSRSTLHYPSSLSNLKIPDGLTFDQKKNTKKESTDKCGPYLCTGYWAILLQEPCPLCAMALLHSRVSRIFYGVPNPKTGILGSKAALHSIPGVNHRYQVWSSVLEDECSKCLDRCLKA